MDCSHDMDCKNCTVHSNMADQAWTPRNGQDALAAGFAGPVTPPQPGGHGINSFDQHPLFHTPPELLCPITLTIFRDPVINTAGHTYERHAMESYFASSDGDVDPLSRTPLPTRTLTPVHVLRSRALEYRQRTANTCIEVRLAVRTGPPPTPARPQQACTNGCQDPARYVRRACELAGDDLRVKGLSPSLVAYVASHSSNAYDAPVLQAFAQSLLQGGYRDKAASVYCNMLQQHGVDRSQQAALLKRCLECWAPEETSHGPHNRTSVLVEANTLDKLAVVVQGGGFSWATLLELAGEADQGAALPLALCEQLLKHRAPPADAAWWAAERDLLMRFVQLSVASMRETLLVQVPLHAVPVTQLQHHADGGVRQHRRMRRLFGCLTMGLGMLLCGHPVGRIVSGGVGLLLVAPDIG